MNARIELRKAMKLLGFVALSGLSAAAFSQSTEYRRGYDQGYRDGVAAAQQGQGQGQHGPAGRIIIDEADYGTRERTCDARPTLRSLVGWRRHVEIRADNQLCGDPVPDRVKRLRIVYRCGDGGLQRITVREGEIASLYCK